MLEVLDLSYGPPNTPLLQRRINFTLSKGELLHIEGANGTGKSLLLRALIGLNSVTSGEIRNQFPSYRFLPQMQNRAAHLPFTIGDILSFSKHTDFSNELIRPEQHSLGWNRASGGERQRALLSRFFCQTGDLLLLDEPFNHLDSPSKETVRALIVQALEKNPNSGAILISHDDTPSRWMKGIPVRTLCLKPEGIQP